MRGKKGYRFLEHMADAYIAAYGKDLAEALENAAAAMFDVMTDIKKVGPEIEDYVEVSGEDEYALLYNWLEALLVKAEIEGMLYSKFKITELNRNNGGFRLKAKIWGEKFNPQKHVQKVGVKAVTYHQMEIVKKKDRAVVKFILDI
ncbi:MAG: archease [Candidatus Bathyarchaeia archaeon]|nr:archease [Candidatus Bathyarchaeota archaeon]